MRFFQFLMLLIALIMLGNLFIAIFFSILAVPFDLLYKKWKRKQREKELEWYMSYLEEGDKIRKHARENGYWWP